MDIGSIFLKILANDTGFEADLVKKAQKAGDAAGMNLGQRMGAAVQKHGAQLISGALTAGIGLMTKGLIGLEDVTAKFAATTGVSADEADRAGKAINAMSGRNIQPLHEIGDALTKVYTDLHLSGDEAYKVTQLFLTFGRATGQEAAGAVDAFKRILDAWNLTAAGAAGLMDKLVVAHQRYGGSIANNEAALANLAPALQAANLKVDDGIALLNLFEKSGVDSAVAVTGMQKALAHVKSPEELARLIAQISATVDPFERAKLAITLFGAKAGAKLAEVLKPGADGIADLKIKTEDATGATKKAADVLDSTWGARFQLMMNKASAAVIGFGQNFGPALTGLATVGTLVETVFGEAIGAGLGRAWNKVASSAVVTKAVAFASGKAATAYIAALLIGDAIGGALETAWNATGGRIAAAAGIQGATAGRAFALGAAAAIVAAPLAVLFVEMKIASDTEAQGNALKDQTAAWLKTLPTDADLQKSIKGVQEQLDAIPVNLWHDKEIVADVLNKLVAESNRRAGQATTPLVTMASTGVASFDKIEGASTRARAAIVANARRVQAAIVTLTDTLLKEAQALISGYYDPIIAQDDLRVQKDTIATDKIALNAARVALAKTKAGSAEQKAAQLTVDQAKLALDQSMAALDATRGNLLAAGALSVADQKVWLDELRKKYKTATGSARADLQKLIDTILGLQHVADIAVRITAGPTKKPSSTNVNPEIKGEGGPVYPGRPYVVGDKGPEIFVPEIKGSIIPNASSMGAHPSGLGTAAGHNITIYNPQPQAADEDIGRMLRRIAALGIG